MLDVMLLEILLEDDKVWLDLVTLEAHRHTDGRVLDSSVLKFAVEHKYLVHVTTVPLTNPPKYGDQKNDMALYRAGEEGLEYSRMFTFLFAHKAEEALRRPR